MTGERVKAVRLQREAERALIKLARLAQDPGGMHAPPDNMIQECVDRGWVHETRDVYELTRLGRLHLQKLLGLGPPEPPGEAHECGFTSCTSDESAYSAHQLATPTGERPMTEKTTEEQLAQLERHLDQTTDELGRATNKVQVLEAALDSANHMIRQQGDAMGDMVTRIDKLEATVAHQAGQIDRLYALVNTQTRRMTAMEVALETRSVETAGAISQLDIMRSRATAAESAASLANEHAHSLRSQMRQAGLDVPTWPVAE